MHFRLTRLVMTVMLLAGCASQQDVSSTGGRSDPLEGFNRTMFSFNYNVLDPYVVRPVAVAWRDYVPPPARSGMSNFLGNLDEPAAMVNSFLRGDPYRGMIHFNRFFLNTILGMGGFIDVAGMANPKLSKEAPPRFGGTLGAWGVGYGPYVELPFYGGATLREDGGNYADTVYPALGWLTFWMSAGKWTLQGIENRSQLLDSDAILRNSNDPYSFIRNAYFQHHDFLANGGRLIPQENPNAAAIEDHLSEIDTAQ